MFTNVTFFEPTPFPPSTQDSNSLQHVVPMHLVDFFVPFAPNT